MIRFLSKRYSKKRKNKHALKISNPILMQDGEANYPAALLNLSSTIPVQRSADSETTGLQTTPASNSESQPVAEPQGCTTENGPTKYTPTFLLRGNQSTLMDKYPHPIAHLSSVKTECVKVLPEGDLVNKFESSASRPELRANGETNLHVFHHVRPPRNVIQCRVEMLDGAFYHVQLPVRT